MRFMISLLMVVFGLSVITAQNTFNYGDTVTGALSNDTPEVSYTFNGVAGDVVIAEVCETEQFSDLNYPFLTVSDASGNVIAQSSEFNFKNAVLAVDLQADGAYTLTVSGNPNYPASETIGNFTLTLEQVPRLAPGSPVSDGIRLDDARYYLVESPRFDVRFTQTGDNFLPLSINVVDPDFNELQPFAIIAGSISASNFTFVGGDGITRYIIAVGEIDIFDPEAPIVQFELELQAQ